jgi:DNA-binding winged helix-turn-helix (wHTH) protein
LANSKLIFLKGSYSIAASLFASRTSLQILVALLERSGEVVDREELRNRLWPSGTYVDFDEGVNTAISKLRYALHDSAETPVFVETVPRRGYRFLAPISDVTAIEAAPGNGNRAAASRTPEAESSPSKPPWWKRKATIAAAACVAGAGLLYPSVTSRIERQRRQNELRQLTAVPLNVARTRSITQLFAGRKSDRIHLA